MTARIIPVGARAHGLAGAFRMWKRWVLTYKLRSNEQYLALCASEGIVVGDTITEWRRQADDMRAQLRALEGS